MEYEQVLDHFRVTKRGRDTSMAICPCHDDRQASLSVSRGNKGTVLKCHAGCKTEDIVAAVGLTMADLFSDQGKAATKARKPAWVTYLERNHGKLVDTYTYCDPFTGEYRYMRARFDPKSFGYFHWADPTTKDRALWGKGCKACAIYTTDLQAIKQAASEGKEIYFVEGEKDCKAMAKHGFAATFTCGSADDWDQIGKQVAPLTKGAALAILADFDGKGKELAEKVARDCKPHAASIRALYPCKKHLKADISNFFEDGGTVEQLRELMEQAGPYDPIANPLEQPPQEGPVKEEEATAEPNAIADGEELANEQTRREVFEKLGQLHAERYPWDDIGRTKLFGDTFRGKHRYSVMRKDWMLFDGKRWTPDTGGKAVAHDAKQYVRALCDYAAEVDGTGKFSKAVAGLASDRTRERLVRDAQSERFFGNVEFDSDDYLLNVQNGILDLSGDEPRLLPHDPERLITKVANASYDPNAKCPLWEATVAEIMQGDEAKTRLFRQAAGLSLTGDTRIKKFFICHGRLSQNGKSTLLETMGDILGDYTESVKAESFAQRQGDGRAASPDIAKLQGIRYVIVPEPEKRITLNSSLIKTLTGGVDKLTARQLYQPETRFRPRCHIFFNANHLPVITDSTVFERGSAVVIPFNRYFEERERDMTLPDRLRSEADGILLWMIRGLMDFKRNGLLLPDSVKEAIDEYQKDNDKLGRFFEEVLERDPNRNLAAGTVYGKYKDWCDESGYQCESKGNFFGMLKERGRWATSGTVNGKTVKNVIPGYSFLPPEKGGFVEAKDTPWSH